MNTRKHLHDVNPLSSNHVTDYLIQNVAKFTDAQLDKISFAAKSELLDRENKDKFDGESQ